MKSLDNPTSRTEGDRARWVPALTPRSVIASLLALLCLSLSIQYSTVMINMISAGSEFALPLPGVAIFLLLLALVFSVLTRLRWQLLSRAELLCVFYTMVIAAPLMTQGFWHRVIGITSTIPRSGDFKKMDFFSDRLWPHGPNLLKGAFPGEIKLEGVTPGEIVHQTVLLKLGDRSSGGVVPGEPYLISFQSKAGKLGGDAFYFVRARVPGSQIYQQPIQSRDAASPSKIQPDGFVRVGNYGFVFSDLGDAKEVELEFGLSGQGLVVIRDPKLMNVSAMELTYSGIVTMPASVYATIPPENRVGIVPRPANLISADGVTFLFNAYCPPREWLVPAVTWGSLLILLLSGFLAINAIMRRQWMEGERYSLPLARIPSMMLGEPGEGQGLPRLWTMRVMWVGVALGLGWGLLRGFHFYNPAVPDTAILVDLKPYFNEASWGHFWDHVTFQVTALFVAVAVFVELNVLMSLVVGFFAFRALYLIGFWTGWEGQQGYPFAQQQQTAGFLCYGIIVLILSYKYLWNTICKAVKPPAPDPAHPGEAVSYRAAYILLAAVLGGSLVWGTWVGVSPWGMALYITYMLLIGMVSSKFRAEAGVPNGYFTPNNAGLLLLLVGGIPLLGPNMILLSFITSFIFSVAVFFLIPGAQLEIMELGRRYRINPRHVLGIIILGVAGGLILGGWVFLQGAFSFGGGSMRYAWAFEAKPWYFGDFTSKLSVAASGANAGGQALSPENLGYIYGGAGAVILTLLRQLFAGFWLHPIGFILGPSHMCLGIWGSLLVAWVLRLLFVRFGGAKAVRTLLQPFFVGVFTGSVASWVFWFVCAAILRSRGVEQVYGALP